MDLDKLHLHPANREIASGQSCTNLSRGPLVFWSTAPDGTSRRVVSLEDGTIVDFDDWFEAT